MNSSDFLDHISALDCVVCGSRPVEIHHIESVRDNDSDFLVAALCADCHRGPVGVHGSSRMGFERRTKISQTDLVKRTIKALWKSL